MNCLGHKRVRDVAWLHDGATDQRAAVDAKRETAHCHGCNQSGHFCRSEGLGSVAPSISRHRGTLAPRVTTMGPPLLVDDT